MQGVVIYGVGSPIVVEFEESIRRAGLSIAWAVKNVPGDVHLINSNVLIELSELTLKITNHPHLIPLFSPGNRQNAALEAKARGFTSPFSLIDPSVETPQTLKHGAGLYVNSGCSLGAASYFGDYVFINRGVSIGHHANLEAFCSIGPGAVVAGQVSIGKGTLIGAGAVVLPQVTIGENSVVGAGAVVTKDVSDNCLVLGNPGRIIKQGIPGYGGMSIC